MNKSLRAKKRKLEKLREEVAAEELELEAEAHKIIFKSVVKSTDEDFIIRFARSEALQFTLREIWIDTHSSGWFESSLGDTGSRAFGFVIFRSHNATKFRCTGHLERQSDGRRAYFTLEREGVVESRVELRPEKSNNALCDDKGVVAKSWPFSDNMRKLAETEGAAGLQQAVDVVHKVAKSWFIRLQAVLDSDDEHAVIARENNPRCGEGLRQALRMLD